MLYQNVLYYLCCGYTNMQGSEKYNPKRTKFYFSLKLNKKLSPDYLTHLNSFKRK